MRVIFLCAVVSFLSFTCTGLLMCIFFLFRVVSVGAVYLVHQCCICMRFLVLSSSGPAQD